MISRLIRALNKLGTESPAPAVVLRIKDGGFEAIREGQVVVSVDFESITKIVAFKRDLGTTDLVCLEVATSPDPAAHVIEIHEEMVGFGEVVKQLEKDARFLSNWREKVLQPPFKRQETILFPVI